MTEDSSSLKFKVADIRERQGLSVSCTVPSTIFDPLPEEARLKGPLSADLEFSVGGNRILLQAALSGSWLLQCSRCLKEHPRGFKAEFEETYDLTEEFIDLRPELAQAALIEIPTRSVCSPDCKGFRAQWGGEGEEPPKKSPFDELKKLKKPK